ncbi:TIR domain-containing protein [Bacteroides caecimuris]|uniref:TIR domain-containing protein n=1 Tax=Bacteroides caecimuris TaxID=1796613 RepID=UPI0026588E77|nr:TIR domain-containing protein [Bacteroides caecimuris]
MKVFLSWSGHKSHQVALVLRDWLPSVIQSITPYVSSEDIDKGARWSTDIAKELEDSTFGLLCVTKENLEAPWLLFEAGALSKMMDKSYVCPFIFDLKRAEVKGPILQFQSTIFEKEDVKKLVLTLNRACGASALKEDLLTRVFSLMFRKNIIQNT